jgi:superoxide dismutase, Fe-Mn family
MKKFIIALFFSVSLLAHAAPYQPKDYSRLLGMKGFGDDLLNLHFQLYKGYVKNLNLLQEMLKNKPLSDSAQIYDFGALKRRIGWEFDGMRLHELYFENLGGTGVPDPKSPLCQKIATQFGSFDKWKGDFIATGSMRGIGWVILYQDLLSGNLTNVWVEEHDLGHFAASAPLLVMDVWEHAYITQFALDRSKYIDAFFANIDWSVVNQRSQ